MAEGGKREAGDVKEKRAFNLLFFAGGEGACSVGSFRCDPRLIYSSSVIAIRLDESERSSRRGRILGVWGLNSGRGACQGSGEVEYSKYAGNL